MRKSVFKRFVDMLSRTNRGFMMLKDNPAGSKLAKWSKHDSRRGCDGTLRR